MQYQVHPTRDLKEHLKHLVDHAAHLLPAQGPIGVFVHHNTLHSFEHLPFEEAVCQAAKLYNAEPFLTRKQYQAERKRGRILDKDILKALDSEPDRVISSRLTRKQLRSTLLISGLRDFTPENIEWQITECNLLEQLRPDLDPQTRKAILENSPEPVATRALFTACYQRLPKLRTRESFRPTRPRDTLLRLTGVDLDEVVHPLLIKLCANFLDQGLAYWPMPDRDLGFYRSVRRLMRMRVIEPEYLQNLHLEFQRQRATKMLAPDVVLEYLQQAYQKSDWQEAITAELLALAGWSGLMRRLELDPLLAPYEPVPCSLIDLLAVRLTLSKVAIENISREHSLNNFWKVWQTSLPVETPTEKQLLAQAAKLFDVAQLLGLSSRQIELLSREEFQNLNEEVSLLDDYEQRRILHLAYELRHEELVLDPLKKHRSTITPDRTDKRATAQVIFCIDEREESMRRALEEIDPEIETESAAGFFGVAVNYRGIDDAEAAPYCPVVVKPEHAVVERVVTEDLSLYNKRLNLRKFWSIVAHNSYVGSRTLFRGWIGTLGLGIVSIFPLITRVLTPRTAGRLYGWLSERLLPVPRTELTLMRRDKSGQSATEGQLLGFSPREKAERVASVLKPAGLVRNLSRLVVILGHGSTSLNNPHESAHDCGACGGRRGGPNARLFAAMANRPEVKSLLRSMGVEIAPDTVFVGGYHDTCNDDVIFFDEELIPETHKKEFERVKESLDRARAANALERVRRFEAARSARTPEKALLHVQERSEHLAEPRPEYGHATNAVCIIGRRSITRGLFLDRRAFLVSYDPTLDSDNSLLAALLSAAGPVCAGINLEYYFSYVDNERYGCGTKLPHNVTGLVGVMNGHSSDLRTGLPWQMVEIHEPVRLLLIVETTPERLMQAVKRSPSVAQLIEKRWVRLATIDPQEGHISVYRDGLFYPFTESGQPLQSVTSSEAWYRGKIEHLPIVRIQSLQGV